jgi:hypothetical protein
MPSCLSSILALLAVLPRQPAQPKPLANSLPQIPSVLAEKRGFPDKYFTLFFAFSLFFGSLSDASHCLSTTSGDPAPPRKIVPKNRWKVFASFRDVP